jgi:hypothetical protein
MFEDLFVYPKLLVRHRAGPSADARERFLAHCAGYGAAHGTLLRLANELLVVAERIDVNSGKSFSLADVEAAAESWTRYQLKRGRAHGKRWPRVRISLSAGKGDGTILYRGVFHPCRDPVTHPPWIHKSFFYRYLIFVRHPLRTAPRGTTPVSR